MTMRTLVSAAVLLGAVTVAHAEPAQLTKADYDRAARFLAQNQDKSVLNASVAPHWLPGGDRFWYRRQTTSGHFEFVIVDAAAGGSRKPAFDHAAVAAGLTQALGKPVEADELPFQVFRFGAKGAIEAVIDGKLWSCAARLCTSGAAPAPSVIEVASPDGKWLAYVKDYNIWIKPAGGGEGFALTTDGVIDDGFGTEPGVNYVATGMRIAGAPYPPALLWSPDSTRILTQRVDDRKVAEMGLLQSVPTDGSVRPKLHSWRMPQPNDTEIAMVEPWVLDVAARTGRKIDVAAFPFGLMTPVEAKEALWSPDGKSIALITRDRYSKTLTLYAVDPATGAARTMVSEKAKTFIEASGIGRRPMISLLSNGDVLWFSERDGQGRLYLYGPDGQVKRVLGAGAGQVTSIVRLDEAAGQVWVRANGREPGENPYLTSLYRVDLKTGATVRLTPENAEHEVAEADDFVLSPPDPMVPAGTGTSFSPSGRFFVDTYSTVDTAPVSLLRRADGKLVATLERADLSPLKASGGVTLPQAFTATAADGTTTLYGVVLRPSNFDPAKRYPVVDQIYPGPQTRRTPNSLTGAMFDHSFAQAVAELGFVVVLVDGRGTPGRSKAFLDESYGKLFNGGFLEDHIAAIKELAKTRPWMDLDKVGIYGISGGGNATGRAMFAYPDFFKVGVAASGNHDQRGYLSLWGETYNGPLQGDNYTSTSNAAIAKNLKGKLLLMHGDMDNNVSPALTMQVVDALIKANKDFDLLIVPNQGHAWGDYGTRKTWDYLVTNLMGATPPKEYLMPKAEQ
jgi:dipeptidyl-peptidase-4